MSGGLGELVVKVRCMVSSVGGESDRGMSQVSGQSIAAAV